VYVNARLDFVDSLAAFPRLVSKLIPALPALVNRFGAAEYRRDYLEELQRAQDDLYSTIEVGEIKLDLLPIKSISSSEREQYGEFRLIGIQLNVALQPANGVNAQSLSVKIEADNEKFQFGDTDPSTRLENIGSHELGISGTGKFVRSKRESEKIVAKMSVSGLGADSELVGERSTSVETSESREAKVTRLDVAPAVISAAVAMGFPAHSHSAARWRLSACCNRIHPEPPRDS
jgi:hypothetical protein